MMLGMTLFFTHVQAADRPLRIDLTRGRRRGTKGTTQQVHTEGTHKRYTQTLHTEGTHRRHREKGYAKKVRTEGTTLKAHKEGAHRRYTQKVHTLTRRNKTNQGPPWDEGSQFLSIVPDYSFFSCTRVFSSNKTLPIFAFLTLSSTMDSRVSNPIKRSFSRYLRHQKRSSCRLCGKLTLNNTGHNQAGSRVPTK